VAGAYIGIGSNLGDRRARCLAAVDGLLRLPGTNACRRSSLYLTEPVGPKDQPEFVNLVVRLDTQLDPRPLLLGLQALERELGRVRDPAGPRNGPRAVDLDLLLHGGTLLQDPDLVLPHPRLHERRFVLEPLCELDAALRHPRLGLTVKELLVRLGDGGGGWVRRIEEVATRSNI
jgi:2-amino-4-hydroxy-6-hydroxymethyldihydropteridine diphosphokinase